MNAPPGLVEAFDLSLRVQASRFATALGGRQASAAELDNLFLDLVALARPSEFLEVGAAAAEASLEVSWRLPDCRVRAFEATPEIAAATRASGVLEGTRVEYIHCAIGDTDGTCDILLDVTPSGAVLPGQSLLRRSDAAHVRSVTVPSARLDTLVEDPTARLAMWIDIEGALGLVLDGAQRALGQVEVLKVEVEDAEIWRGQSTVRAVLTRLMTAGLVPVARDVEYAGQYNLLLVGRDVYWDELVRARIDEYLHRTSHELWAEPGPLRRSETLRAIARPVRRVARGLRGRLAP